MDSGLNGTVLVRSWNGEYPPEEFKGMFVLGFAGLRHSGKTTVADAVVERLFAENPNMQVKNTVRRLSFSDHLKRVAAALACTEYAGLRKGDCVYGGSGWTVRDFLMEFGTSFVRDRIGEDFWVDVVANRIHRPFPSCAHRPMLFVIDDVRYPNEYGLVKSLGTCVLLERLGTERVRGTHSSEEPEKLSVPCVIENNGDLADTVDSVFSVLRKHSFYSVLRSQSYNLFSL